MDGYRCAFEGVRDDGSVAVSPPSLVDLWTSLWRALMRAVDEAYPFDAAAPSPPTSALTPYHIVRRGGDPVSFHLFFFLKKKWILF
jgi:hypothetical protein